MRIIIFGATGGVGQHAVRFAAQQGHEVTAFVRTPEKLEFRDGVKILTGDALVSSEVRDAIPGHDGVISCLSSSAPMKPSDELERMTGAIVAGMAAAGTTQIAYCASAGVDGELTGPIGKSVQWMLRHPLDDHRRALEQVRAAGLDWTIARPTSLKDAPFAPDYRESLEGLPRSPRPIPRASVAHFLVKALEHPERYRHTSVGLAL